MTYYLQANSNEMYQLTNIKEISVWLGVDMIMD